MLSEADFARLNGPRRATFGLARFAQPSRLVWAADERRGAAATTRWRAAPTLFVLATPMKEASRRSARDLAAGFALTYGASCAPSARAGRNRSSRPIRSATGASAPRRRRRPPPAGRRRHGRGSGGAGKLLSLVRLAKAATTYAGGADYLAWKINRHAGTKIAVRPWQRRWPILGALILLPRLLLRGAIR